MSDLRHTLHLVKVAYTLSGIAKGTWKAAKSGSGAASKALEEQGAPKILSKVVEHTPEIGAAVAAKKGWDSETAQKMRYKYRLWKARRAQARAMRGYQ